MHKPLIITAALVAASLARATDVVVDPTVNMTIWYNDAISQLKQDLARVTQGEQLIQEKLTALKEVEQVENQIVQLARMGDPAALKSLPVVGSIAELAGDGQKLLGEYQQLRTLTSPQYLKGNLAAVQSAYGLGQWNPTSPGAYQFSSASYQVSTTIQDQMTELEKSRQSLEQKRDQTMSAIAAATDQSTVQKLTGSLVGVNGALAELAARESALAQRGQLQQMQLTAGHAVQTQQRAEQQATQAYSGIDNDFSNLPTGGFGRAPLWTGR